MSTAVDRQWAIRNLALQYLYVQSAEGRVRSFEAEELAALPEWQDGPLSQREVDNASNWLSDNGFLTGTGTFGGGVLFPTITGLGERYADLQRSVRGPLEDPVPVGAGAVTIHNSGSANFAVHSTGVSQTLEVSDIGIERANGVAATLEAAAGEAEDPESQLQAQQIAEAIREQTASDEPNRGVLKALMLQAAGSLVTALSTAAASQVGPLALEAAHSFL